MTKQITPKIVMTLTMATTTMPTTPISVPDEIMPMTPNSNLDEPVMTQFRAYREVGEAVGLKPKQVKAVVEAMLAVAATQTKLHGSVNIAGAINLKLKKKTATPSRNWIDPETYTPYIIRGKPASQKLSGLVLKKFKNMINAAT